MLNSIFYVNLSAKCGQNIWFSVILWYFYGIFSHFMLNSIFYVNLSAFCGHYFGAIKEQKMPKDNILVLNHFLIALFWCYKVHAFFAPFFVGIFNWTLRTILVLKRQPLFRTIFCLNQQSTQFTHMSLHYLRLG